MVIMKYNAVGDSVWTAVIDTFTEYNTGVGLAVDSENGLYALGGDWSMLIHYKDSSNISVGHSAALSKSESLRLYPSPASNNLEISSTKSLGSISIYDVSGKLVFNQSNITGARVTLNVKSWPSGLYFVRNVQASGEAYLLSFSKE